MKITNILIAGGVAVSTMVAFVAPAAAVVAPPAAVQTTFASYSPIGSGTNLRYGFFSNAPTRSADAKIYSIATSNSLAAGSRLVNFSVLLPQLSPFLSNITARWTFMATVAPFSNVTPSTPGAFFTQPGISGSFSFLTTQDITISGGNFITTTYLAGSNLLSGTFSGGTITGNIGGSTGSSQASTVAGGTLTFTSDFLNFDDTLNLGSLQALSSVNPTFKSRNATSNKALDSFFAVAGGAFSADNIQLANSVPEPQTWVMLVAGFGLVGVTLRRRSRAVRSVVA